MKAKASWPFSHAGFDELRQVVQGDEIAEAPPHTRLRTSSACPFPLPGSDGRSGFERLFMWIGLKRNQARSRSLSCRGPMTSIRSERMAELSDSLPTQTWTIVRIPVVMWTSYGKPGRV